MQFMVDECTGPAVARWLRGKLHQVLSVYEELRGATDDEILDKAFAQNRILITNDRDFGEKIYRERRPHRGIVFLRPQDERAAAKIEVLEKLLNVYSDQFADAFVVVTASKVRFART